MKKQVMKEIASGLFGVALVFTAGIDITPLLEKEPPAPQPVYEVQQRIQEGRQLWTEEDAELLAKTLYGEARASDIPTEQKAAVVWCVLNRVDAGQGTIEEVVTKKRQFVGYDEHNYVTPELYDLAVDVLERWQAEHEGQTDVGRTLPAEYLYFTGDGERNYFTTEWHGHLNWDWSLPSPY